MNNSPTAFTHVSVVLVCVMIKFFSLFFYIFMVCSSIGQETLSTLDFHVLTHMKYKAEDNVDFKAEIVDLTGWSTIDLREIYTPTDVSWLRASVTLPPAFLNGTTPLAVHVAGGFSTEIYWNGVLLGKNGLVGETKETEVPGKIDAKVFLPIKLIRNDENQLAIRFSSKALEAFPGRARLDVMIGSFEDDSDIRFMNYLPALLMIGAITACGIYFSVIFLINKKDKSALWLAFMFFSVSLQFGAEILRGIFSYPYPYHALRLFLILLFALTSGIFLNLFVVTIFNLTKLAKRILPLGLLVSLILIPLLNNIDNATYSASLVFISIALGFSIYAWFRKHPYAPYLSIGFIFFCGSFLVGVTDFLDGTYYYAMTVLAIVLFTVQAVAFENARASSHNMENLSNRLELELLKKQIQPHFIMNTLMALSEWIIESPKIGVKMIQALAKEFRLLNDISGNKVVSISREIDLCQAHLELMSYRKDHRFQFDIRIENEELLVPPAIFHTLIENALTHNRYQKGEKTIFTFRQTIMKDNVVNYILISPLGKTIASPDRQSGNSGLGLSYVNARLEESFLGQYKLTDGTTNDAKWQTTIQITYEDVKGKE